MDAEALVILLLLGLTGIVALATGPAFGGLWTFGAVLVGLAAILLVQHLAWAAHQHRPKQRGPPQSRVDLALRESERPRDPDRDP